MIDQSFAPVIWLLVVLSLFVTYVTNLLRRTDPRLAGELAARDHIGKIYVIAGTVGTLLALVLHADILAIVKNPEGPALFLGWRAWQDETGLEVLYSILGAAVTGAVLAFLSKIWNDLFDLVHQAKRWARARASEAVAAEQQASDARKAASGTSQESP